MLAGSSPACLCPPYVLCASAFPTELPFVARLCCLVTEIPVFLIPDAVTCTVSHVYVTLQVPAVKVKLITS